LQKYFILFTFLFFLNGFGQNLYLKIDGASTKETSIIDSLRYKTVHKNYKIILEETITVSDKLAKIGYLESKIVRNLKVNDSTFLYQYELGAKTSFIHIYTGKIKNNLSLPFSESKNDTLIIPFLESERFLLTTLKSLEKNGYSMAKVKLVNVIKNQNHLEADLSIELDKKRFVNDIVINGYDKFPRGFKKNIFRMYRNKTFTQESLEKINNDFNQYRFIKQTKYPEILFLNDSTKVYVYLEKAKANTFDGFIGFSNDENGKVIFNGYLDLVLNNILNSGEKVALYWKSDGRDQKTFNLSIEMPYLFKSPIGLKAQINIFKQDSLFQNTRTNIDLGYFLNYNNRLYLGYQATESSDIQNTNSALLNDYSNNFITLNYEFFNFNSLSNKSVFTFLDASALNVKIGTGKRTSKFESNPQYFGSLNWNHNFYLNTKNVVNIKSQNYYLQSSTYIVNELYRFGGITSIRGFNENSLQGNVFTSLLTEYRYVLSPSIYAHSIIDYGYVQDRTSNVNSNLLGFGFGFGLLTKNGLFNLIYANGSTDEQQIKLSNSIVHISFKATF
jgi:hypothetical protein